MYTRLVRGLTGTAWRRRALFATMLLGLTAAAAAFAAVMVGSYKDVSRGVETAAANVAAAVSQNVDRNIEMLDLSVQAVTAQWSNPAVQALDTSMRDAVLFNRATTLGDFGWTFVLNRDGQVVADSRHAIPPGATFSDRDYFRVHILNNDVGLFVSKPFVSRVNGLWIIVLSRRLNRPDGSFDGVVAASLPLDYLSKLYKGLNLGRDSAVILLRTDGRIVTREPYVESDVRRIVAGSDTFNVIRASRAGTLMGPSPLDGKTRVVSFHRVGNLPLIQDVEVSVDQAYADWWRKTSIIGGILGCLGISSVALMALLGAELTRRVEVEAKLERLVATDPLTQLPNRRRFEDGLDVEWRRAVREGTPVSLLMIDADAFKAYNDTYGHPAGDGLLKTLATCIAGNIRRPGDLAARFGGEEFVVLLPSTDAAGAVKVAEDVRAAVAGLAHPHERAATGIATVSIGSASVEPLLGQPSATLLAAADEALYRAKAAGRNCVRAAPPVAQGYSSVRDLIDSHAAVPQSTAG